MPRKYSGQSNQYHVYKVHDGRLDVIPLNIQWISCIVTACIFYGMECNTSSYTNLYCRKIMINSKDSKFERKCKEYAPVSSTSEDWMICVMCFMAASAMSTTLSTIKLPSVSKMWQLLNKKSKSLQWYLQEVIDKLYWFHETLTKF